jgi:prepilin-type processing-associated H-X9-DG protein
VEESSYMRLRMGLRIGAGVAIAAMALGLFLHWVVSGRYVTTYEQARRTICRNNLSQLGRALEMYARDFRDLFPAQSGYERPEGAGDSWGGALPGEIDLTTAWCELGRLYPSYTEELDVFLCPSSTDQPFEPKSASGKKDDHPLEAFEPAGTKEVISYSYSCDTLDGTPRPWTKNVKSTVRLLADKKAGVELTPPAAHHGLGRNVLYADGSVEWFEFPGALDPDDKDDDVGPPDAHDYSDWWSDPPWYDERRE